MPSISIFLILATTNAGTYPSWLSATHSVFAYSAISPAPSLRLLKFCGKDEGGGNFCSFSLFRIWFCNHVRVHLVHNSTFAITAAISKQNEHGPGRSFE